MKYLRPSPVVSPLLFSPADALRASTSPDVPVVEIVTFRLLDGSDTTAFLAAARKTEAMLRDQGALIRRYLVVDADNVWSDIIEWTSMETALAASEAVMQEPDFQPLMQMIDPGTVSMRHAPILWRID